MAISKEELKEETAIFQRAWTDRFELTRDDIDRGSVSFSIFSDFDPDIYRRLTRYLDDCVNNILPHAPFDDDVPTIPRYRHHFRTDAANLNYYEPFLLQAAEHYVRYHQRNYQEYQNSQEKLDTKKQKGSSTKRISRKQRKVSKQQKRNSRT